MLLNKQYETLKRQTKLLFVAAVVVVDIAFLLLFATCKKRRRSRANKREKGMKSFIYAVLSFSQAFIKI